MRLTIRKTNLQWSDALAGYARRRVQLGLDRVSRRVRSVAVRLADVNGPGGGEDKHCVMAVRLVSGPEIRVNARDSCAYRAVDAAVDRLKRLVSERTKRQRERVRSRGRSTRARSAG